MWKPILISPQNPSYFSHKSIIVSPQIHHRKKKRSFFPDCMLWNFLWNRKPIVIFTRKTQNLCKFEESTVIHKIWEWYENPSSCPHKNRQVKQILKFSAKNVTISLTFFLNWLIVFCYRNRWLEENNAKFFF